MQEYVLWFTKSNLEMKTNCRKKISFQKKKDWKYLCL